MPAPRRDPTPLARALNRADRRREQTGLLGSSASRGSRINNFDALRLLAALAVLVAHSFAVAGAEEPSVGGESIGTLGVYVFFGISGFLIAQSWTSDPHLWRYLAKRSLRILPALVVVLLVTAFVVGPLLTTLPVGSYLSQSETWLYVLKNAVMVMTHELPGLFVDNPAPRAVNAPLHTLQPEVWAYFGVAALGLVGGLRRAWLPPLVAAFLLVLPHDPTGLLPWPHQVFYLQAFAVGTCLFAWRDRVPWHPALVLAGVGAWLLAPHEGVRLLLAVTVLPYAVVFLAYRGPAALRKLTSRGDFSYGIYLWHFPLGQALVATWGASLSPGQVILIVLPLTYAVAAASWRYIEAPALA